jgi:hypothetical protein
VSRIRLLAAVGGAFVVLLAVAIAADSVRLLRRGRDDVAAADRELVLHETRVVSSVAGVATTPPELQERLAAYAHASGMVARHAAYDALVTDVRGAVLPRLGADDRRVADAIAGGLNRRDIAARHFDDVLAACDAFAISPCGRLARGLLGVPARCDEQPSAGAPGRVDVTR